MLLISSGLKVSQKTVHEISIVLVNPRIIVSAANSFEHCLLTTFLKPEEIRELSQEILEKESRDKFILNLRWKLVQEIFFMLIIYSHVSIIVPLIVKKCFNSLSYLNVDALVSIESLQQSKESGKFIAIIKILIQSLNLLKNFNKVTHDI